MKCLRASFIAIAILSVAFLLWPMADAQVVGNGANPNSGVQYGVFYRPGISSPFGSATGSPTTTPAPYPTNTSSVYAGGGVQGYCNAVAANGASVVNASALDSIKAQNILDLKATWTRTQTSPEIIDSSTVGGAGVFTWGKGFDQQECFTALHGIDSIAGTEVGPIFYNDGALTGGFIAKEHNTYDTPSAMANMCSALATHTNQIFGYHHYSIPGNELNADMGIAAGHAIINGSPPAPVPVPTSNPPGGTLIAATQYQYRITEVVNGVETLAGPEYYQTIAPGAGNGSIYLYWGAGAPVGGAVTTVSYKVYGRTAGAELFMANVAATQTVTIAGYTYIFFIDNGSITPSGALPATSTITQTAFESQLVAYTKPCYQAIKAADPQAFVWGMEMDFSHPLVPTPDNLLSDMKTLYACGPGTCYDGISMHLFPNTYPFIAQIALASQCLSDTGSGDYGSGCVTAMENTVGPIPAMIGETGITVPGVVATEATAATASTQLLQMFASTPFVRYILWNELDDCAIYPSGFFLNGCLITPNTTTAFAPVAPPFNLKQLRWYAVQQIFNAAAAGAVGNNL